jgi:cytochrome c oxidase subunit 3
MATTVTSTERKTLEGIGVWQGPGGGNGKPRNGHNGGGGKRDDGDGRRLSLARSRITIRIVLAGVVMMFGALTVSYIFISLNGEWNPISLPWFLWLSTGLIVLSSLTFRVARKYLKDGFDRFYSRWLLVTALLGLAFLGSQLLAWRQLVAQGIYLASNPHSGFFYLLTGAHGVHLLGGIIAIDYLLLRTRHRRNDQGDELKRETAVEVVALYWHFMDGLWICLFLLLLVWK